MHDETIHGFMDKLLYEEVIPTLTLDPDDCKQFASDVTDRFANPYVDHQLLSISLNSTSKWKARVMPSFKGYVEKYGKLPVCITASFAFYEMFYHQGKELTDKGLEAVRPSAAVTPVVSGPSEYVISDDRPILEFYYAHKDDDVSTLTHAVLSNTDFWGEDLTKIEGFEEAVTGYAKMIEEKGAYEVMKSCLN
jgi:tagaturonate reductase